MTAPFGPITDYDSHEEFEKLDAEWMEFCKDAATGIAEGYAKQKPHEADPDDAEYVGYLDDTMHQIAIARVKKTAEFLMACIKQDIHGKDPNALLESVQALAAFQGVLDYFGESLVEDPEDALLDDGLLDI